MPRWRRALLPAALGLALGAAASAGAPGAPGVPGVPGVPGNPGPMTVAGAFPLPPGATRVPADPFGLFLLALPLRPPGAPVRLHTGAEAPHSLPGVRVVDLPLVPGDLQQCADSAYRLRAAFLLQAGAAELVFHATSGQALTWSRWVAGDRVSLQGDRLVWRSTDGARGAGLEGYLTELFKWAGTRSLVAHDTVPVADGAPRPGDLIVAPGSPGHAVVLLDVARGADGGWLVIVGEGFMPAQDFHIHPGPVGGWWPFTADGLALPWWPLPADGLRRWR
jgi:hypothetical protein